MKSAEYDLRYLQAGLEALEDYLLSNDVFWQLGVKSPAGEPEYPQLTLDWVLLSAARLNRSDLTHEQTAQVERAKIELDKNRTHWKVAWERKAGQCFQLRGRMWRDYLQEYQENRADNAGRYAYEVRLRTMLELLQDEFRLQSAEIEFLSGLDGSLKSVLSPGEFIWEPEVKPGFPENKFWFLYGKLPAGEKKPS
jgi:hypothetical protein